jgi:hypothetical protein
MARRTLSKHPGGVRPGVWIFAAACLLAAVGIAAGLLRRDAAPAAVIAAASRDAAERPIATAPAVEVANEPSPAPRVVAAPDLASAEPDAPQPSPADPGPAHTSPIAMTRADAPGDSRLAAEIRVLETEAARVAESLALLPEAGAAPRDRAAEDARVQQLADALLVEHFVQDAYRGTEFPSGYPAEERTRAGAEAQVRGLTPEMRRDLLDVVLQGDASGERIAPQFAPPGSGFVWESAAR